MKSFLRMLGLLVLSWAAMAAEDNKLCLHGVCIGDDLLKLDLKWVPLEIGADARQYYDNELQRTSPKALYDKAGQKIVADPGVMSELLPYLLDKQGFDDKGFKALQRVQAFCSNITLKGQLALDGADKVFVTAQSVPPTAQGMQLRVVRIEKIFDVYHPMYRPEQGAKVKELRKDLKKLFPGLIEVRDIDDPFLNDQYTDKPAIMGFKFTSDVSVPMALKLRDVSDVPALDDNSMAAVCKI